MNLNDSNQNIYLAIFIALALYTVLSGVIPETPQNGNGFYEHGKRGAKKEQDSLEYIIHFGKAVEPDGEHKLIRYPDSIALALDDKAFKASIEKRKLKKEESEAGAKPTGGSVIPRNLFVIGLPAAYLILHLLYLLALSPYLAKRKLRRQHFKEGIIIEQVKTVIEFRNEDGSEAIMSGDLQVSSMRRGTTYHNVQVYSDGSIEEVNTYNCTYRPVPTMGQPKVGQGDEVEFCLVLDRKTQRERVFLMGYSLMLKNSFVREIGKPRKESFYIDFEHYNRAYDFSLVFPTKIKPLDYECQEYDSEEKVWKKSTEYTPQLIPRQNYFVLRLVVFGLDKYAKIQILWTW